MRYRDSLPALLGCLLVLVGCQQSVGETQEIARFPADSLEGVLSPTDIHLDTEISSDGNGSFRIDASGPRVIRLYEVGDIDVEDARLIYRARLRSEVLEGQAYLEMWCRFGDQGEFFSRGLDRPLTGSVDWTARETPFFLKKGENPDGVKLNLVIDGRGTVWIDDIVLLRDAS